MSEDNSLKKYQGTVLTSGQPANNFNRPNVTDIKPSSGRLYSTQYNNIWQSTPKVNWNSASTKDPILNFGSTSSSISGGGFLETMGKVASGITLFGGMAMTGLGIASAVKTLKGSKSSSDAPAADQNLSSLTETANNYDKKSDANAMLNTATNLTTAISTSKQKLSNAQRTSNTAQTTITNLNKSKVEQEGKLTDFITQKDSLQTSITSDKNALSDLKNLPEDQRPADYATQVSTLERRISDNESKLKTEYSNEKQTQIENQIKRIEDDITKWTNTKLENDILIKQLPNEIKEAEKALKSLNKKLNV